MSWGAKFVLAIFTLFDGFAEIPIELLIKELWQPIQILLSSVYNIFVFIKDTLFFFFLHPLVTTSLNNNRNAVSNNWISQGL